MINLISVPLFRQFQAFLNNRFIKLGTAITHQQELKAALVEIETMMELAKQDLASADRKVAHETEFNLSPQAVHWWFTVNKLDPWIEAPKYIQAAEEHGFTVDEDFKLSVKYLLTQPRGTKEFPGYDEFVKAERGTERIFKLQ